FGILPAVLDVTPYRDESAAEWDEPVQNSTNGNIFHLRRFLAYHPKDRFRDASFLIRKRGNLVAVVPAVLNGDRWVSHGGASYGGFVLGDKISFELCRDVVDASLAHVKSLGAASCTVTLPPSFYRRLPHDYIEACLLYRGFRYL